MLHLVTGTPGASKTAYVVTQLDQLERKNKTNLKKNKLIFEHNKPLFDKYHDDFSYIVVEVGSGHELKNEIVSLPDDYFLFLTQDFDDLRPDYYFQRTVHFNEIIERINDRDGHQDFEQFQPVRTIYTNIKALKIDYVRANVHDWRVCPDGSVIVIDEVQLVDPYSDVKKKDDIVQHLTIHRHRGFDFWFITQAPSLLHPTIKELIGLHLHITRPYGRTPKIYQFGSTRAYPNTLINKMNCEAKFNFTPQPRIFKLYKSTTIDTHQKRFPKGLIGVALFILFGISIFFYSLSGGSAFMGQFFGRDIKPQQQTSSLNKTTSTPITGTNTTQTSNQSQSYTAPPVMNDLETKAIQDKLSERYSHNLNLVSYNPLLHVSAVIIFNGQCRAYNHYSELISMSKDDCLIAFHNATATRESQDSSSKMMGFGNSMQVREVPEEKPQSQSLPQLSQPQSIQLPPRSGVVVAEGSSYDSDINLRNQEKDSAWSKLVNTKKG